MNKLAKSKLQKFDRYSINLSKLETAQILKYLAGDISSRELGNNLGVSHQQAINFTAQVCRQWFQQKALVSNPSKVYEGIGDGLETRGLTENWEVKAIVEQLKKNIGKQKRYKYAGLLVPKSIVKLAKKIMSKGIEKK